MTVASLSQPQQPPAPGTLVLIGTYTDYEVLPHWPHGTPNAGGGIVVARWSAAPSSGAVVAGGGADAADPAAKQQQQPAAALQVLHTVPALNPAFMKCVMARCLVGSESVGRCRVSRERRKQHQPARGQRA
jgi:hypothetical protein